MPRWSGSARELPAATRSTRFPLDRAGATTASSARASLDNFLWVTFTRSDPARDVHGVGAFIAHKHWGCTGPLVIDARIKPHHAPPLEDDPRVSARVDALFQQRRPAARD